MTLSSFRLVVLAFVLLLTLVAAAKSFHVEHQGRLWQWTELVRALDGYIKVVDRGRHSRFWNFMAAWYQSPHAIAAAADIHMAEEGVGGAIGDDDDVAGMLAGAAAAAAVAAAAAAAAVAVGRQRKTPSTILVDDWVALWIMGKGEDDLGELVIGYVLDLYGPGRRHGYVHLDSADAQTDAAFVKIRIHSLDLESRRVTPRSDGVQFDAFAVKGIARRLVLPPADGWLHEDERCELMAGLDGIREGARRELKARQEAASKAKEARDAKARAAGRDDASKLTVELMKEELRARKKRGELIAGVSGARGDLLERLQAARQEVPNIPDLPLVTPPGNGADGGANGTGGAGGDGAAGGGDNDGDAGDGAREGRRPAPVGGLGGENMRAEDHEEDRGDDNGIGDAAGSGLGDCETAVDDNCAIDSGPTGDDQGAAVGTAALVGQRLSGTVFDINTGTDGTYPGTLVAHIEGSEEPFLVHYDDGDVISYNAADWEKDIQLSDDTVRYCKCARCMSAYGRRGKRIVV